jgi:hypothetical protein
MNRTGLVFSGMVLHAGGLLAFVLGGHEGTGCVLYLASIPPLAVRTLLWRRGWAPGS